MRYAGLTESVTIELIFFFLFGRHSEIGFVEEIDVQRVLFASTAVSCTLRFFDISSLVNKHVWELGKSSTEFRVPDRNF